MDWVTFWTWAVQFVIACALLLIVCVVAFAAVVGIRERNDEKGEANPAVVLLIAGVVAGAVLASVAFWFVGSLPAHAAPSDPFCVALSEARSVTAGEPVRDMLTRIAPEARPRFHTRHIKDVDGCGRNTVYRFRFQQTSSGRAVVAWKWLSCRLHSECVVVVHYPEPRS